ncbi:hypothetical protein CR513_03228, partial [Mucuna pruriens]
MKIDKILACFNYDEYVKVRMVTYKFSGYALVWWNQCIRQVREGDGRANVLDSNEATMTRLLHGLNRKIQDVVKLCHYASYLVHQATRRLGKGHIASQCPNKRNMLMREDRNVESESSCKESSSSSEVECSNDSSQMRMISSRCHVKGKLCYIIIDGGNSVNVASLRIVEKLNLPTLVHLRPYNVDKQVSLAFTLGKYSDEILCNVVPMEATYILLGDPQTLSRRELSEDQLKMKVKKEKEQK